MEEKRYRVLVQLKTGVLDVQGKAIESTVSELGIQQLKDVRVGKVIEFTVQKDGSEEEQIQKLCNELLSNPVIENYTYEVIS